MRYAALMLTALLALAGFGHAPGGEKGEGNKPILVASTTQIADFLRQVVGDRCEVHSILAAGADPHLYEPRPKDAFLVKRATLCFENGLHLEGKNWMGTLAKGAGKPIVVCTDGVRSLEMEEDGGHKVNDPHAWFSPKNAAIYVNNILRGLVKADPEGKDQYVARAALFMQQLKALDAWIRKQFNAIPPEKRILVTSHDAFNYFCRDYGFKNETPVGWSTGSEVGGGQTPERRRKVIASIKNLGVKAIFVETSVNPKLIREIAREAGVKIGGELYSDSMGAPGTSGETYIGMMRENTLKIVGALK
jgi:manganese/iron transport system substrate-binding protein